MQPYMEEDTGTNVAGSTEETQTESQTTEQQTTTSTETVSQQPKIPYKFMDKSGEMELDEATAYLQKGMNYERAVEKAKQEALDEYIAGFGYEWNGKPIKTKAEYDQALREKEIYDKYKEQGLPEEVIEKLAKVDQIEAKMNTEERTKAQQEKQQAEYKEFFNYFKAEHGRDFDAEKDVIPQEVWQMREKGKTLTDAYTYYDNFNLKKKLAEYETKLKAQETNQANAASSTGSVTGNGITGADHISFETYEANKHDQSWVNKNFNKIMESRTRW